MKKNKETSESLSVKEYIKFAVAFRKVVDGSSSVTYQAGV